jgi:hypothetical protein
MLNGGTYCYGSCLQLFAVGWSRWLNLPCVVIAVLCWRRRGTFLAVNIFEKQGY